MVDSRAPNNIFAIHCDWLIEWLIDWQIDHSFVQSIHSFHSFLHAFLPLFTIHSLSRSYSFLRLSFTQSYIFTPSFVIHSISRFQIKMLQFVIDSVYQFLNYFGSLAFHLKRFPLRSILGYRFSDSHSSVPFLVIKSQYRAAIFLVTLILCNRKNRAAVNFQFWVLNE